jgi:hypothetical protein
MCSASSHTERTLPDSRPVFNNQDYKIKRRELQAFFVFFIDRYGGKIHASKTSMAPKRRHVLYLAGGEKDGI